MSSTQQKKDDLFAEEPNIGWTEALGEHATNPRKPRETGETITALGKKWRVSKCENRIKAQFEQWLRGNAEDAIDEVETRNPDRARQMRSNYLADRAAGRYNWNGSAVRESLADYSGLSYLLYLLLRRCHPEMTPAMAMKIFNESEGSASVAMGWAMGNPRSSGDADKDRQETSSPDAPKTLDDEGGSE